MSHARKVRRLVQKKLAKGPRSMIRRYIVVPEDLPLVEIDGVTPVKDRDTDKPITVSFQKFLEGRTTDPAYVSDTPRDPATVQWTMPMVVSGEAVRAAFRKEPPGAVVELDDDDYQRLKRGTEKGTYHAVAAASLIGFMRVVMDAKTEDPRKKPVDAIAAAAAEPSVEEIRDHLTGKKGSKS